MANPPLRVALFTDAFEQANGVATVSRQFVEYARAQQLPFCCVLGGNVTRASEQEGVLTLELKRSRASFPMDAGLYFDLFLNRHCRWVLKQLRAFRPNLIHIIGPGDLGILGFWISHLLKIPMVASWHTNLHEYASRRVESGLWFAPANVRRCLGRIVHTQSVARSMASIGWPTS